MVGAQVSPSVRRALTLFILSVLSLCVGAAVVAASPLNGAEGQQAAAAQCRLVIVGRKNGTLHQASMNCTCGTSPTLALNKTHLRAFADNFAGVKLADGCNAMVTGGPPSCLITICAGSIVLRNSRVSWVRNNTVKNLVCVVHGSRLAAFDSRFTYNEVRPLMIGDQASVMLHASNVSNNIIRHAAYGGGLWVEGHAVVTITGGSRVEGNLVGGSGGGLAAFDHANVAIEGRSVVQGNTAGVDGGGLTVGANASVVIAGGGTVTNNTAVKGYGGGLDMWGNARLTITEGSRVHENFAVKHGGGLAVRETANALITGSSTVQGNTAGVDGGGLTVGENASVVVAGGSSVTNNTAVGGSGGGLDIWGNARLTVTEGSRVHGNLTGKHGGGLAIIDTANVTITGSSTVHGNTAGVDGGGLTVGNNASVMIAGGSTVSDNTAVAGFGGGVYAWGDASVTLTGGCMVLRNMANRSGGGVFVGDSALVAITNSMVHDNVAQKGGGGGVHAQNVSTVAITNSSIGNNTSTWGGGGVAAWDTASVTIIGGSSIHGNMASSGGGVVVGDSALVAITDSMVHDNVAQKGGGGVFAQNASKVAITNNSIGNNTSALGGGGLAAWDTASVTIIGGSSIHGNMASNDSGGGVASWATASVTIIGGSTIHGNMASKFGGGVAVGDSAQMAITDSTLYNNTALLAGGGIGASGKATLVLANTCLIHNNRALDGSGGGLDVSGGAVITISGGCSIVNNSCAGGVGGGISAGLDAEGLKFVGMGRLDGDAARVGREDSNTSVTISNCTIANNTSHRGAGGGLAAVSKSIVRLTDSTKVVGNRAINSSGGAVMVMGDALVEVDCTVVFANNSVPRGFVGSTIVAFDNSNLALPSQGLLTKCSSSVYLGRTPCGQGEVLQHDVCLCCPPHTFSFGNSSCTQCPPNAACPGASIVEPLPGFWSSAATSIQMHRCPLFKTACDYANQTHMCKPGYRGPLCGDCQLPENGMLTPMRCGKCMPPSTQLGLYLMFSFLTVIFVDVTVHFTWQDNLRGDRAVYTTDFIKVLVLFLQYTVIIGSVSVPWPLFDVQLWLQAIGILVTMGSGQAMSLDCWLWSYNRKSKLPIALQRQLVYFLAPLCTLVVVLAVQCLVWVVQRWVVPLIWKPKEGALVRRPFLLWRKLPVTVLVLLFYAFPTLVRASLSFFACLAIDKPLSGVSDVPVGATAPLSHRWGYWVSSIEQQCFAGYHLGWSMGLGLPSVLFWCLIVPVAMGVGLYLCKGRADTDSFREHFGFLYRTYKPECMWWEAVWAARTVVLTLISVFAFPMQRYFSVLSLLLIFLASAVLQIMFQPYEFPILHRMHLVSTSCLAATTLGALAMFAYDIQESTAYALRIAITVLVFVVNLVFVGWCCVKLVPALREGVVKHWPIVKAWLMGAVAHVLGSIGHPPGRKGRRGRRGTSGSCWCV